MKCCLLFSDSCFFWAGVSANLIHIFYSSTCGGSVDQNCSYIKNPNYPSQYGSTTACSYTIKKCDPCKIKYWFGSFRNLPNMYQFFAAVCQFRLDFENFLINGPADTSETGGGACQDSLTTTTSTNLPVPKICGSNVGHHSMTHIPFLIHTSIVSRGGLFWRQSGKPLSLSRS